MCWIDSAKVNIFCHTAKPPPHFKILEMRMLRAANGIGWHTLLIYFAITVLRNSFAIILLFRLHLVTLRQQTYFNKPGL